MPFDVLSEYVAIAAPLGDTIVCDQLGRCYDDQVHALARRNLALAEEMR